LVDSHVSVGVGGWAYFPLKQGNRLSATSKLFDFVELNSSFYKLPEVKSARKWRSSVSENFEFSMRANHKLTHENHLEPTEENFEEYQRNLSICKALRAFVLHFQFPPSFNVTREVVDGWRNFFSSLKNTRDLNFAIEVRNPTSVNNAYLRSFLNDFDIIPTSDPFKSELQASSSSRILYSRVFGLGEHTKWSFSTTELQDIEQRVAKTPANRRYVTFHNITMYEDGARLKNMLNQEGHELLAPVTGVNSLKESLVAERLRFPVSAEEMTSQLSWRTMVLPDNRRIHVDEITRNLDQNIRFDSLEQILAGCKPIVESESLQARN
jgi:uncharacterized protein YecE (DUF72 family)